MSWLINSKIVADTILGYMEPNTAGQSERCGTRKDGEYDAARRERGMVPTGPATAGMENKGRRRLTAGLDSS